MDYLYTYKPPIVHQDLKPENLLINVLCMLKISDFGLVKILPSPTNKVLGCYKITGKTGSYRYDTFTLTSLS